MNGTFTRIVFGVLVLALAVLAVRIQPAAGQAAPATPAPVPTAADKTEVFFKNIQVLKGLPADLMQPSMQMMEIALGVHCVYSGTGLRTRPRKSFSVSLCLGGRRMEIVETIRPLRPSSPNRDR